MAEYTVSHPELPEGINGVTTVETVAGSEVARELAAAHAAAILRHRNLIPGARPDDVVDDVIIEEISK